MRPLQVRTSANQRAQHPVPHRSVGERGDEVRRCSPIVILRMRARAMLQQPLDGIKLPMQHGVVDTIPVNLYGSSSKAQNQQHQHKQHQQKMGQTSQRKISLSCPADAQNLPEGSNLNESTWYHPRVRCRQHSWLLPLPLRSWHAQREQSARECKIEG